MILETAALCLALNIYHEARSEMIPGQYAVAQVTMNRAGTASNVCKTVTAKDQFSWTRKALVKHGSRYALKPNYEPKDERAWDLAQHIAGYVLKNKPSDITFGATHYHTVNVYPVWRYDLERTKKVGKHIFYKVATKSQLKEQA